MKIKEPEKKHQLENILPMVNVVFLLLIFFMVAGAYSSPEMFEVSSPETSSQLTAEQGITTIQLTREGRIAIGNIELTQDNIIEYIQQLMHRDPIKFIQLKADADVEAVQVVRLIEQLSETQLDAVHLLTTSP